MRKWTMTPALSLALLLAVCGVALAALGDQLTSEFFVTLADNEVSKAECSALKNAANKWMIFTWYTNKIRDPGRPGFPHVPAAFSWVAPGSNFSEQNIMVAANSTSRSSFRKSHVVIKQFTGSSSLATCPSPEPCTRPTYGPRTPPWVTRGRSGMT